jgi:hypothetical protein
MLDKGSLEQLRIELEAQNVHLWIELVAELHVFRTSKGDEAWFFFLIDEPSNIPILADIYLRTVQSSAQMHYPETEFFMGVYQHFEGKELFWGEIDGYEIRQGKLNEGFGHDPIINPLPIPEQDVFTQIGRN